MMTYRIGAIACVLVGAAVACEQASAPPPEAPPGPSAVPTPPEPTATTPVAGAQPDIEPPATVPAGSAETAGSAPPAATDAPAPAPAGTAAGKDAHHPAATKGTATAAAAESASAAPAPTAAVDDPCQTKNFHYSQIAGACKSGGRKAAKGVMKGVVQKAKAAGTELKCTSCHEDMKDFHLKSNAVGDLKNWL
jgi:hypothetical protein